MSSYQWAFDDSANRVRFRAPADGVLTPAAASLFKELHDNGVVEGTTDGFSLDPRDLYLLSPPERETLDLPEDYPFDLLFHAEGVPLRPAFRVWISFAEAANITAALDATLDGPFVDVADGRRYLLTARQYGLVQIAAELATPSTDVEAACVAVTKLQTALRDWKAEEGQTGGVEVDGTVTRERIVVPDQITLDYDEAGYTVGVEGLGEDFQAAFAKTRSTRPQYAVGAQRMRVVLTKELRQVLDQVKSWQRKPATAPSPRDVISGKVKLLPEAGQGEALRDLVQYGERVIELGQYRPKFFPFISEYKSTWIPGFEGTDRKGQRQRVRLNDFEKLAAFTTLVDEAVSARAKHIVYEDCEVPLAEAQAIAATARRQLDRPERPVTEIPNQDDNTTDDGPTVLIIHDNATELTHTEQHDASSGSPDEGLILEEIVGLPTGIALKRHQERGVAWLQTLFRNGQTGCVLGDDMGLGKTLQILSFVEWHARLNPRDSRPYLVVAPVSLLENWAQEYARFFPKALLSVRTLRAGELGRDADATIVRQLSQRQLLLTNYETLQLAQLNICAVKFALVILDEAQQIKNPGTLKTSAAKALQASFRIAMTGTPVENTLTDLWSLVDFTNPGLLDTVKAFRERYEIPAGKSAEAAVEVGNALRRHLDTLFLRRMKSQVAADLPSKEELTPMREMPPEQAAAYLSLLPGEGEEAGDGDVLVTLMAMRKVSAHPALHGRSIASYAVPELIRSSARLQLSVEILDEIEAAGEAIVFAIYKDTQRILQRVISHRYGFTPAIINGDTPATAGGRRAAKRSRQQLINEFGERSGFNVIIMSPVAAGVGLNVVAANHVIHYSRHWNPAKEDQATDRAYRIGQTRPVKVYYPTATLAGIDTFDQVLARLLSRKRELAAGTLFPSMQAEVTRAEFEASVFSKAGVQAAHPASKPLTIGDVDKMDGRRFEYLVAALYIAQGRDAFATKASADHGADVVVLDGASPLLVQTKCFRDGSRLSNSVVQEVVGALRYYAELYICYFTPVVVTNRHLSKGAHELAASNDVTVVEREQLLKLLVDFPVTDIDIERASRQRR